MSNTNDLIPAPDAGELSAVLHSGEEIPLPFEREIFLIGLEVAGLSYIESMDRLYASLQEGDPVRLVREPKNPYDEYAIRVETDDAGLSGGLPSEALTAEGACKLGYIPRGTNRMLARLMDAGKRLYATVRLKEIKEDGYYKIVIKVYMKD